jgi:hypothetical protein
VCGGPRRSPDAPHAGEGAGLSLPALTLAELDEDEQSLDRLRRWYRTIRARDLFGAPSAARTCSPAARRSAHGPC